MARRTGVILAAGFGSRLRSKADERKLKPLTPVAGVPLIFRAFRSLEIAGCDHIVVVTGFRSEALGRAIREGYRTSARIELVVNDRYDLANGVSVLAAADRVEDDFIVTMADHVLGDDVMQLARRHRSSPGGATLLVDRRVDEVFDLDDATKVKTRDGLIVDIGKQIPEYDCIDTGVFVCTRGLVDALQAVYDEHGDASLSQGVARLAQVGKMSVLDIGNGFWQDVDTPEMLAHAEAMLGETEPAAVGS